MFLSGLSQKLRAIPKKLFSSSKDPNASTLMESLSTRLLLSIKFVAPLSPILAFILLTPPISALYFHKLPYSFAQNNNTAIDQLPGECGVLELFALAHLLKS